MIKSQIPESIQQEFECALCSAFLNFPTTIQCGHTFCRDCILQAYRYHPRCPICRVTITIDVNNLKENLLIKSTVKEIKKYLNLDDSEQKQFYEEKNDPNTKQQSLLYFFTDEVIIPCQYQRIELLKSQFAHIRQTPEFIKQIFQNVKQIVIAYKSKNQTNIGYLAQLQLVQVVYGKIIAQVLIEQLVSIEQYGQERFSVSLQGQNTEIQLLQATVTPIEEEEINVNDQDTAFQIKTLISEIKEILNPFIQQLIPTKNQLCKFLYQSGVFMYLQMDIEKDAISLKRFSYLLPSVLNINREQKINILSENSCIQRLFLLNRCVQNFRNTTNPMAVFRLSNTNAKNASVSFLWPIIIALIIAALFRVL